METTSELRHRVLERLRRGELRPPKRKAEPVIERVGGEHYPLSCGQQQIWLHSGFAPGAPIYNESITIGKRGALDPVALEAAFNEIVRRHAIWRTSFVHNDGEIVQTVVPELYVPLPVVDYSHLPSEEALKAAIRLSTEDAARPFDLSQAPLLRGRLVRLAEDDHRLYLTFHHLVFDGVSIYRVFFAELMRLYRAFSTGEPLGLPELPIQYGDYAAWQQRKVRTGEYAAQIAYWRETLREPAAPVELPAVKPHPGPPSWRADMEAFFLPVELSRAIKDFSAREGCTLYMTLLAAFHALLYRYSAQERITTGAVVSTRNRKELEPLMGFLLNTVVNRSRPDPSLSFREFLGQVRDNVLGAIANSEVPFDAVVRELAPKRDRNPNALFEILFSLRPSADAFPNGWDLSETDVHSGASGFGLFVDLVERPEQLVGRFVYATDRFERSAVTRIIRHWQVVLEAAIEYPDLPIGRLPLMTDDEKQSIIRAGTGLSIEIPNSTLAGWIEKQTAREPRRTAVMFEREQLTYQELDRRAMAFAQQLRAADIRPGALVGISVERSIEMLVAVLGILKCGAVYLPLDPGLPVERRELLLSEGRPHFLVASKALTITDCRRENYGHCAGLAYLLYTSGSTGIPKGVEVPEGAVVNFLRSMQERPGFAASDVLLAVTTLSFDIAVLELLLPLVSGGTVVIANKKTVGDPMLLKRAIRQSNCTVMQGTPAMWRSLIQAGWVGDSRLKILCGGEALPRALADQLLPRCHELWNMYGPTETTVWSTVERVEAGDDAIPIGQPIHNTQVYVLDRQRELLPAGIAGELYIGGSGVARGYAARPELTEERFLPSPFIQGERIYRTGDLATWRSPGVLEFLGRADNQVKVRGYRIELQEIEDALLKAPGVRGAAVKASHDPSGENALIAYVEGYADTSALREYLGRKLPAYMVPSRFVTLDALPLTPNGKLDRKALPDEPVEHRPRKAGASPRTPTEERLAAIWAALLKHPGIAIDDDFFHLGGHSLLAAELSRRINLEFGKQISLSDIFKAPTIAGLSELIASREIATCSPEISDTATESCETCLYWMYGGTFFHPLAAQLRPGYRLQDVWLPLEIENTIGESDRLEDVARLIALEMRKKDESNTRPSDRYYLGGWCVLGILAYEVAVQLRSMGEDVALVVLLGAPNPQHYLSISRRQKFGSKLQYHWNKMARLQFAELPGYVAGNLRYQVSVNAPARARDFNRILMKLALRYEPKPLSARVALFQGEDRPSVGDYATGWASLAEGGFAAYDVPGGHTSSLEEPNVSVLGRKLRDCLDETRQ